MKTCHVFLLIGLFISLLTFFGDMIKEVICGVTNIGCSNCVPVCGFKKEKEKEKNGRENMRPKKKDYYLNIALEASKRSTCLKRHYGCIIVKNDEIIATGYNGSPRGCVNCCDVGECQRPAADRYFGYENCLSVHAEQNAMISARRDQLFGSTLYLTCESYYNHCWVEDLSPLPCKLCVKMIINAGISKIVTRREEYDVTPELLSTLDFHSHSTQEKTKEEGE